MSRLPRHLAKMSAADRADHDYGVLKIATADTLGMLVDDLGITRAELARRLGKSEAWVSKALSGSQNLTLRSISRLAHALGTRPDFRLRPGHRDGTPAESDPPLPSWVRDGQARQTLHITFGTRERHVPAAGNEVKVGQPWKT